MILGPFGPFSVRTLRSPAARRAGHRPPAAPTAALPGDGARPYCSAMMRSNSTSGLTGACSSSVTVAVRMVAVHRNGA